MIQRQINGFSVLLFLKRVAHFSACVLHIHAQGFIPRGTHAFSSNDGI